MAQYSFKLNVWHILEPPTKKRSGNSWFSQNKSYKIIYCNSYKMTVKLPEADQNLFESSSVSSQAIRLDITTGHTSPSIPSPPGALPAKRVRKCAVGPPMSPPCCVALIRRSPSTGNPRPRGGWGLGGCRGLGVGGSLKKNGGSPKSSLGSC